MKLCDKILKSIGEAEDYIKEMILEPRAHADFDKNVSKEDQKELEKILKKFDNAPSFQNSFDELEGFFPIDTVKDLFEYLKEYAKIVRSVSLTRLVDKYINKV